MLPEQLIPEKEVHTKSLAEARNLLETDFRTNYVTTVLDRVVLEADGHVAVEGRRFPVAQSFLEGVAKEIQMPLGYAYQIDPELFVTNFDRRKHTRSRAIKICLNRGVAVNIAKADYRPARSIDVLNRLRVGENFWNLEQAIISDRGVEINYIPPDVHFDTDRDDTIQVGIRVSNSETGYRGLKASFLTLRLVCSNGAVIADDLGTARWNHDKRVTYKASIEKFQADLRELQANSERVLTLYEGITERQMPDREFVRLWRRLRHVLSPETVDDVLQIEPDQRREVQLKVRARRADSPPEFTRWRTYDLHNNITFAAQHFEFQRRRWLETIGGHLLSSVSQN